MMRGRWPDNPEAHGRYRGLAPGRVVFSA
jgi:hypothetical protein